MRVKNKTNQVQHIVTFNGSIAVGPGKEAEIDEKSIYDFELLRMENFFSIIAGKTKTSSTVSSSKKKKTDKGTKKEDVKSTTE